MGSGPSIPAVGAGIAIDQNGDHRINADELSKTAKSSPDDAAQAVIDAVQDVRLSLSKRVDIANNAFKLLKSLQSEGDVSERIGVALLGRAKSFTRDVATTKLLELTGQIFLRKRKFDEAAQAFQAAIAKGIKEPQVYHSLGVALANQGKGEEAEKAFLKFAELSGGREQSPVVLCDRLIGLGDRYLSFASAASDARMDSDQNRSLLPIARAIFSAADILLKSKPQNLSTAQATEFRKLIGKKIHQLAAIESPAIARTQIAARPPATKV